MGKAERTRAAIIEQAAPLFNRRGYAGTSLSDLTGQIRLTKGAIYGNFTDKQDLAVEALKYNIGRIADEIRKRQSMATSHLERLLAYPEAYRGIYKWILSNGGCPIANTLTEADDTNPALNRLALLFVRRWRRNIEQIVRAAQADGCIKSEADGASLAQVLLATISGGAMLAKATRDDSFMDAAIKQAAAIVINLGTGE
ncbi:MAG: TetR/AcrR family transcriptional regulator [Leptospirales bacterium]|jgi:TetR/AcrR family transcriptional repressor of nem operon